MDVRLTLKGTVAVIGSVSDFTYKWSLNAGLVEEDAVRFALAVDELVTDVVLFAYPDEPGEFEITFRKSPSTVEVIVHELGVPFNPERHIYDPLAAVREGRFDGAGFALIRHLVDDFIFLNKGRGGKEFRLTKIITSEHIADIVVPESLRGTDATVPPMDYVLAPLTQEDAEDVARLIYRTYGYTYIKEDLYFPKKIEMTLEQGNRFGVLVRTPAGEAVGYFAVLRTTDSMIGEVGEAVVLFGHRRRGIMTSMLHALIEEAHRRGLLGLMGEAVTVHDYSQRANHTFNFRSTALLLNAFPSARYKGLPESPPETASIVVDFLPFLSKREELLYLPEAYADLLMRIYAALGIHIVNAQDGPISLSGETTFEVTISYAYRHAEVVVDRYGRDAVASLLATTDDLLDKAMGTVYLDLPLADPGTRAVVEDLRASGYVLSGLMPLFHHENDYLRLQRLAEMPDFDTVRVFSDVAQALKSRIREELSWNTSSPTAR